MNNNLPPLENLFEIIKHDTGCHISEDALWSNINKQLDSEYHIELFSENVEENASIREKYIQGLSEYIDNECSIEKSKVITKHLAECSICRDNHNAFISTSDALKYTFATNITEQETNSFWNSLEQRIFPEESSSHQQAS